MFEYLPTVVGTPESRPLARENVAHTGLFAIRYVNVRWLVLEAVG
jgi:hypothetical protein